MKNSKTIFVLTFLFTILLAVASCTKPDNPPAPTPAAPVLKVTAPTGTLAYGDSTSFSWTTTGKVTSVTLDSKAVSPSGSHNTGRLLADQSYNLKAIGPGGADSKTVAIKVGDWMTSNYGMISHSYWLFDSLGYNTIPGDPTQFTMYTDEQMKGSPYWDEEYYYSPIGEYVIKSIKTGKETWHQPWVLSSPDTISIIGGHKFGINILTKTKMVLIEVTQFISSNNNKERVAWIKWVYKRGTSN